MCPETDLMTASTPEDDRQTGPPGARADYCNPAHGLDLIVTVNFILALITLASNFILCSSAIAVPFRPEGGEYSGDAERQ